jgi:hypothetical protein
MVTGSPAFAGDDNNENAGDDNNENQTLETEHQKIPGDIPGLRAAQC